MLITTSSSHVCILIAPIKHVNMYCVCWSALMYRSDSNAPCAQVLFILLIMNIHSMFRGKKAKTVGFILFVFMFISMPISNWYSYDSHQPVKLSERCFLVCLKSQPINHHCSQLLLNFYWIEKEPIGLKGLHLLQNKLSWGLNVCIQAWENCTGVTEKEWSWGKKWSILYHLLFFFLFSFSCQFAILT